MSSIFRCIDCTYFTDIKTNLTRHIKLKHAEEKTLYECPYCQQRFATMDGCRRHMSHRCKKSPEVTPEASDAENMHAIAENMHILGGNLAETAENMHVFAENMHIPCNSDNSTHSSETDALNLMKKYVCNVCNKGFTRRNSLKYHTGICKGIINILECPICKKVLSSASSKYAHLAQCRLKAIAKKEADANDIKALELNINATQHAETINNTINNINNIDNSVVNNNNITNNIGILVFPGNTSNESITFDTDLINLTEMATTIKTLSKLQVSYKFIVELLKNPRNRCIKKTNMRSDHSNIHVGDNKWQLQPDAGIYKKLVSEVSLNLGEFLGKKGKQMKICPNTLKDQLAYTDLMSDEGYSANDTEHIETKKEYKMLLRNAKSSVYNQTKLESIKEDANAPGVRGSLK